MPKTLCKKCGADVVYKTKRPSLCSGCKKKADLPAGPRSKRPPKSSKKELAVSRLTMEIFPELEVIHNGYYSWLRSPKDQPMQLDVYVPELNLAIEFDGKQHLVYNPYMFGKGKAGQERFAYLQKCDSLKDRLCADAGILLLRIRHDRTITKSYLVRRLENDGVLARARQITRVDDFCGEEAK